MRALAASLLALGACGPQLTSPPDAPPGLPGEPAQRVFIGGDGEMILETDPFAPRTSRRADADVNATLIAKDVALVVEPAEGAPVYLSNRLAGALVRRFAGHILMRDALSAEEVFLIRPVIAPEGLTSDGVLIVDWRLRAQSGGDVGAVYAKRRLTGAVTGADPWTAVSDADIEHIALQTAAHLLASPDVAEAIATAAGVAALDRTPTPTARPFAAGEAAPGRAPRPRPKPVD